MVGAAPGRVQPPRRGGDAARDAGRPPLRRPMGRTRLRPAAGPAGGDRAAAAPVRRRGRAASTAEPRSAPRPPDLLRGTAMTTQNPDCPCPRTELGVIT